MKKYNLYFIASYRYVNSKKTCYGNNNLNRHDKRNTRNKELR